MPALILWLFSAIGSLTTYAAVAWGARITFGLAVVSMVFATYYAFWVAVQGVLTSTQLAMPSELAIALTWVVPSALRECIAMRVTVEVLAFALRWKNEVVSTVLKAS